MLRNIYHSAQKAAGTALHGCGQATQIVTLLMEGMSVRAVSRITGVHQGTILSILLTVGKNSRKLFDQRVRNIRPRFVQADELWTFVHTKAKNLSSKDPQEWGDSYIWMAIDSEGKLVLSYLTAKRDAGSAYDFIRDLSERVTGRFQITTDGLRTYVPAIEEYFGANIDFAQLLKIYGTSDNAGLDWYKPSQVTSIIPIPISGDPDARYISTSHVERANLSIHPWGMRSYSAVQFHGKMGVYQDGSTPAATNRVARQRWFASRRYARKGKETMTDLFQTSGTSPTTDFICENHGSLFLLIPRSTPAKMWIQEKLRPDRTMFCEAVVIEPRYVWTILLGLQDDGLSVVPR